MLLILCFFIIFSSQKNYFSQPFEDNVLTKLPPPPAQDAQKKPSSSPFARE